MKKDISNTGASRNKITNHRHDLVVWAFVDEMAAAMAEGAISHGEPGDDGHWQKGFDNEQKDIWNHVFEHYRRYRLGDKSEPHLAKMAIGCMFQWFFDKRRENNATPRTDASPTFAGDGCTTDGHCGFEEWDETDPARHRAGPITYYSEKSTVKTGEELLGEGYAASRAIAGNNQESSCNQRPKPH